jgi:hypothetical protein
MNYFCFIGIIILLITAADLIKLLYLSVVLVLLRNDFPSPSGALLSINKRMGQKSVEIGGAVILVSILINWLLLIFLPAYCLSADSLMNVETNPYNGCK